MLTWKDTHDGFWAKILWWNTHVWPTLQQWKINQLKLYNPHGWIAHKVLSKKRKEKKKTGCRRIHLEDDIYILLKHATQLFRDIDMGNKQVHTINNNHSKIPPVHVINEHAEGQVQDSSYSQRMEKLVGENKQTLPLCCLHVFSLAEGVHTWYWLP